jgi:hypothetical protein
VQRADDQEQQRRAEHELSAGCQARDHGYCRFGIL